MKLVHLSIIIGALAAASGSATADDSSHGTRTNSTSAVTNNLLRVRVDAVCISTNQGGSISNQFFGNSNLIQRCAMEMGISNLSGLTLVYDRTNNSLDVVSGTNQTFVCTALSFENGVFITNANATLIQGVSFIFVGTNMTSSGTISTTERITYGATNQITSLNLIGRFQYAIPATSTNGATLYRGTIVVTAGGVLQPSGTGDNDEDDNDDDDNGGGGNHGNHGNNGNHGRGNNGHSNPGHRDGSD